jgi:hypothetical protein
MKTILKLTKATVVVFMAFLSQNVSAQVGIGVGSSQVNGSAALEVAATNKGFLPPRMTTSQRDAISSPSNGLVVYNSSTEKYNVYEGGSWSEMAVTNKVQTFSANQTFSTPSSFNQIGVGVAAGSNDASAAVQINSTTQGFLPPRMSNTTGITTPSNGLVIYNTTTNKYNVYENGAWSEMATNNKAETITGAKTFSAATNFGSTVNFNSPMINMYSHIMMPMGEAGFYDVTGITTSTSATAFAAANSNLNWTQINWPATGATGLSNTILDSMFNVHVTGVSSGTGAVSMKYTGTNQKHFHIALTFSTTSVATGNGGAAATQILFGVFKNGTLLPESIVLIPVGTAGESTAIHVMCTMQKYDSIDLRAINANGSSATTITTRCANFFAMGI